VISVERTHELRRDQDWLPAGARRAGRLVTAVVWTGAAFGMVGGAMLMPVPDFWVWPAGGVGVAAAVASERARRALLRRYLARLTRGAVHLAEVDQRAEGELIVVRGTIEAAESLTGILTAARGVYRRMTLTAMGKQWVHEAAVDFALIDDAGERILIQTGGARWLEPSSPFTWYPSLQLDRDGMPPAVRDLVRGNRAALVAASERVLAIGARVQIVGYKTVSADASGAAAGYRLPPQRATLRSGPALPLAITAIDPLK
jgi:hypothetical protein